MLEGYNIPKFLQNKNPNPELAIRRNAINATYGI